MPFPKELTDTREDLSEWSILSCYRGSVAQGTHVPSTDKNSIDDVDAMVICVPPEQYYLGLKEFGSRGTKEVKHEEWDIVIYEVRKAVRLLRKGNPNMLNALWLDHNMYLKRTRAGDLLIDNRDLFVGKHVYKHFVGYAHGQLHRMTHHSYEGYMGKKRKEIVERHGYDCHLEEETEFLTDSGWKRFDKVANSDMLATVEPASGALKFEKSIRRIDRRHSGAMYVVEPYGSRAVVTPGHRMLVSNAHRSLKNNFSLAYDPTNAEWYLAEMQELLAGRRCVFHIRRAPSNRQEDYNISDEQLALAGLFLSEGTIAYRDGKVKCARVTQQEGKPFGIAADRLMQSFSMRKYNYPKEVIWNINRKTAEWLEREFGHSKSKHLPPWAFRLSARQANILWEHLMLGDGCRKKAHDVYYSSLRRLSSDLQGAMVAAGHPCTMLGPYECETTYGQASQYHVIRSRKARSISALHPKRLLSYGAKPKNKKAGFPVKEISVDNARVVCFEVPTGTLITRSQGRVAIHGNCKNASHLIRILRMGIEFLAEGCLNVARHDAEELKEIKTGKWSLGRVKREADRLFKLAEEAYVRSDLPAAVDEEAINALCIEVVRTAWQERSE